MVDLSTVSPAIALGPLDGRYRAVAAPLVNHLSEAALNRARLQVEVEWLIHLTDGGILPGAPRLSESERAYLRGVVEDFGAEEIAELGADDAGGLCGPTVLPTVGEIVHIFCTSEDINNLSYALTIRAAIEQIWLPAACGLVEDLAAMAREYADAAMLARTHGQPATPTTLGKELAVLAHRLRRQVRRVEATEYLGKINGATGTFGAHIVSVPGADWQAVGRSFVEHLGLTWNPLTTQIESHDWQAELYSDVARFNRIAHNLATDVWTYISLGYFHQRLSAQGSTGSSTMPHKVNPIRFENGEANLEISCSLLDTLAATLVTSRLQRDLTDSTTQRNVGVALGHSLLAVDNIRRGLAGLDVDRARLEEDLEATWEVLGEPVQQAMRAAAVAGATGMADPYERLKELTRGKKVTPEGMREFISGLGMPDDVEARLLALTPATYTGLAAKLVAHLDD